MEDSFYHMFKSQNDPLYDINTSSFFLFNMPHWGSSYCNGYFQIYDLMLFTVIKHAYRIFVLRGTLLRHMFCLLWYATMVTKVAYAYDVMSKLAPFTLIDVSSLIPNGKEWKAVEILLNSTRSKVNKILQHIL